MNLIIIVVFCFFVCLIVIMKKRRYFNLSNHPTENIETDCNFQPKKCPLSMIKCDCKNYCKSADAKLFKKDENYFCYIPHYYFGCKQDYGTYVFDKTWQCLPKYPGLFKTSGEQIVGKYPYAKANRVDRNDPYNVDCTGLNDEYGNKLIKVTLNRGVSFCVKDYCLNNIPNNPASGYNLNTGQCDCTNGTQNVDSGVKTTPCVVSQVKSPFKINCYNEDSYLKDVSSYLIKCPDGERYVASKEHDIKVFKVYS